MIHITLNDYLAERVDDAALADLAERIASACWSVSQFVSSSALQETQGSTEQLNPQGEVQKPLIF